VYFNPRTREGCDFAGARVGVYGLISIHAPVKGATTQYVRGAPPPGNFNPRTREGCDRAARKCRCSLFIISIHAPVKGATAQW